MVAVRPIVVRSDSPIRLAAEHVNPGTAVIVDGQVTSGLCEGDVVEIRKAPRPMRFIPHKGRTFFDTLAHKLQWAASPVGP